MAFSLIKYSTASILALTLATSPLMAGSKLTLSPFAVHESGVFDQSAAEIVAYNNVSQLFYVTNSARHSIDVFRLSATGMVTALPPLRLQPTESPTSVATFDNLIAAAVHDPAQDHRPGQIILFDHNHQRIAQFPAGALPDMLTFSPSGKYLVSANEGEPQNGTDPEGGVTAITINRENPATSLVRQIDFRSFNHKDTGIRLTSGKKLSQDVEPEYIAFADSDEIAWVALQENNALATLDLTAGRISKIFSLGTKDHSQTGQGLDPNDKDGINIIPVPVRGLYMPDGIAAMTHQGQSYILTANEGDSRDEDIKAKKASFDEKSLTRAQIKALGKLRLSSWDGDTDQDGDIDIPHSYGARSFSIFSAGGQLVFDSGDDFERITAERLGKFFNSDNDEANSGDKRSDNKGPEPEGITIASLGGKVYAFITLERVGGIMVYEVTNPKAPAFQSYYVSRRFDKKFDFARAEDQKQAGSLGPEGICVIKAADSPTGKPLLVVANEVSGTVEILEITH